jgi:hypothetical protein
LQDTIYITGLEPLIAPQEVGIWPPAPGWYIMGGLLLLGLALLTIIWFRKRKNKRYRFLALKQLQEISFAAGQNPGPGDIQALNRLLKQTALSTFPREQVASLSGEDWLDFLDRTYKGSIFSGQHRALLLDSAYRKEIQVDIHSDQWIQLISEIETWIKKHYKPDKYHEK